MNYGGFCWSFMIFVVDQGTVKFLSGVVCSGGFGCILFPEV